MTIRKTVLITGGGRGIGAATVRLFAARGWRVAFTWTTRQPALGEGTSAYRCDVRNEADVTALFRQVAADFGRIDALVNNAGITGPRCRIEDVTADLLRDVTATNLIGPILCAREAVRHMAPLGGGSIVNLSSTATKRGSPDQWVHYAATKGAIDVLTAGLAAEVAAQGIRVNAVAPGLTLSDPAECRPHRRPARHHAGRDPDEQGRHRRRSGGGGVLAVLGRRILCHGGGLAGGGREMRTP